MSNAVRCRPRTGIGAAADRNGTTRILLVSKTGYKNWRERLDRIIQYKERSSSSKFGIPIESTLPGLWRPTGSIRMVEVP